jgi:hypothetical protein
MVITYGTEEPGDATQSWGDTGNEKYAAATAGPARNAARTTDMMMIVQTGNIWSAIHP